jgi:hypothetical protein
VAFRLFGRHPRRQGLRPGLPDQHCGVTQTADSKAIALGAVECTGDEEIITIPVRRPVQEILDRDLAPPGQTGKLVISGDPPENLTVRMRVTQGAGGQFVETITQPDVICL